MQVPRILPAGDAALVVEFGDAVDPAINARTLAFDAAVSAATAAGVRIGGVETVPTYRSVLIHYDPLVADFADLSRRLGAIDASAAKVAAVDRLWSVPVVFGGAHGIDIDEVADRTGIAPAA